MPSTTETLNRALAHHRSGELRDAEALYRQILAAEPNHSDALHLLGLIAYQSGRFQSAVDLLERAVALSSNQPVFHANLGEAYRTLGRLDDAERSLRQALSVDANLPDAHNCLGNVFRASGRAAEATSAFERAIALRPEFAEAHNNLGAMLHARGDLSGAIASYRRALELSPNYCGACHNLAIALDARGDLDEACRRYEQALSHDPRNVEIVMNLARALEHLGRLDEALALYDQAIAIAPQTAQAYVRRAHLCRLKKLAPQAVAAYDRAIQLAPDDFEAYNGLAVMYLEVSQPDAAVACCQKGIERVGMTAALAANLATALQALGRQDEAIRFARQSVELNPQGASEHSNLLYKLNFHPAYEPSLLFAEHLRWAARHAEPLTALAPPRVVERSPARRLRVGYVSPYFRDHAVNFFAEPLIAAHDRRECEVFCYSDALHEDAATARVRAAADCWRPVRLQSDEQLAETIRADKIDILVDLTGHISGSRLLVFARKPAPIQVTYLGYQNTTGMSAMDYRLTDALADPPGVTDAWHTERLVRLPRSFFCYRPSDEAPRVAPLPAATAGHATFGSLNNFAKVTPQVMQAWVEILARVADSRLLVLTHTGGYVQQRFEELARGRAVDPARIELCAKRPRREYFELVSQVDVALDPFPFNGHTTTCDSIWMGVPVVMLLGRSYASRFGGSVLANVGLERLMASSVEEYVDVAVELAADRAELDRLRGELRPRMAASALLDFQGFARNVEAAYRQMWIEWTGR